MLSTYSAGTHQENELTRNSSGNARLQSPQFDEPLWSVPGQKSRICVRELISTYKAQTGNDLLTPPQKKKKKKSLQSRKKPLSPAWAVKNEEGNFGV